MNELGSTLKILLPRRNYKPLIITIGGLLGVAGIFFLGKNAQKALYSNKNLPVPKKLKAPEGYDPTVYEQLVKEMWNNIGDGYSPWADDKLKTCTKWLKLNTEQLKYCYGLYNIRYGVGHGADDLLKTMQDEVFGMKGSPARTAADALIARLQNIQF